MNEERGTARKLTDKHPEEVGLGIGGGSCHPNVGLSAVLAHVGVGAGFGLPLRVVVSKLARKRLRGHSLVPERTNRGKKSKTQQAQEGVGWSCAGILPEPIGSLRFVYGLS